MRLRLIATVVVLALLALPPAARATDGYFSLGFGMKAKGMGGASTALAQDGFGGANNPATMAFVGNRFDIGVDVFMPHRSASRTGGAAFGLDGSAESGSTQFLVPEIGLNHMLGPNLALGVSVYGNGGMNTDYPGGQLPSPGACGPGTPPSGFNPQSGPYNLLCGNGALGVNMSQAMVAPTLAWQFAPGQAIGIAPVFAYQTFEIVGLQAFAGLSTSPSDLTNNGFDTSTGWGARLGYYGTFGEKFSLGATYATKVGMSKFTKYQGLFAEGGKFDIPENWSVGIAFKPTPQWVIAADYEEIYYSKVPSVGNPSSLILNCAGGDPTACLGGSHGAGFGWQDVTVWKLGVQVALDEAWTVRFGYNRSDNPILPQDVTINILAPGVVQNHFTAGATWSLDPHNELTTAVSYVQNNSVTGASLFNSFLGAYGVTANMSETIQMKQYSVGFAYAHKF